MDDPRDIVGRGLVTAVEGSGIAALIAKLNPTDAARISAAVDRAAEFIPSPEGCGCAAKKKAMVMQMKVWLAEAQLKKDAKDALEQSREG